MSRYWIKTITRLVMFAFVTGSSSLYYITQADWIGLTVSAAFTTILMFQMVHRSDFYVDSRPKYQSIAKARNPRDLVIPLM